MDRPKDETFIENQSNEETLKKIIQKLWLTLGIPKTDQTCFKTHYFNSNSTNPLTSHILLLEKYKKRTLVVLKRIEARESLFAEFYSFLHKENLTIEEFAVKVPEKLLRLREATILVLKGIRKWRKLMWNPQAFVWNSENYVVKVGKDYERLLDSLMFIKLQIFVADFIFFIPQKEIVTIDLTGEDKLYKSIANKLLPQSPIPHLKYSFNLL